MRPPTKAELALINELAKRECAAEEFYVFDAKPANDFLLTSYFYFLGTSSLYNYRSDLEKERLRLGTSHRRDLGIGRWLPGEIAQVSTPAGAKPGCNSMLQAPFYMARGLQIGQYRTDDIAKAIEMGIITDVSIEWSGAKKLECDLCHNDIRDGSTCEHFPGREYDGVLCTFTVQDSHLNACDLVDDGGLPMATLGDSDDVAVLAGDGGFQWQNIKKIPVGKLMSGRLMLSIGKIKQEETVKTFEELCEQYKDQLTAIYMLKADHQQTVDALATANQTLETTKTELAEMKERFGTINAELEDSRPFTEIGKTHMQSLVDEYNRLGTILHGDKWDHETEQQHLDAMTVPDRKKFLEEKLAQMKPEAERLVQRQKLEDEKKNQPYTHLQDPALYKA